VGALVDEREQGGVVEPVTGLRDGEADEQPAERAVPQRAAHRALGESGRRGHDRTPGRVCSEPITTVPLQMISYSSMSISLDDRGARRSAMDEGFC
jgi:hypothetical protein